MILGVTGATSSPRALLLGAVEPDRGLVPVGASVRLGKVASREVGRVMIPAGRGRLRGLATFPSSGDPVLVQPVVPAVAEFLVDVALERGRLRHPARFSRLRLELDPDTVRVVSRL